MYFPPMITPRFFAILLLFGALLFGQEGGRTLSVLSVLKAGEGMEIRVPLDTAAVINGSYAIDSSGYANIPIVGRVFVHDKPTYEIETLLSGKLANYLRDTHIMISPVIRLALIGHWQNPGMHYVNSEVSVWEACLAVGGPNGEGNMDKWVVMRGSKRLPIELLNEFSKGTSLRKAGIQSGDIFVIPVPDPDTGFWYWFREYLTVTAQIAAIASTVLTAYITYLTLETLENNP